MDGLNLYSPRARTHNEEDVRELLEQIQLLQSKLTAKTEALLRVGKDLEEAEREKNSWKAEAANYERNLRRAELELQRAQHALDGLKSSHGSDKSELEGRMNRAELKNASILAENAQLKHDVRELQKDCKTYRTKLAKLELARMETEEEEEEEVMPARISMTARESSRLSDHKLYKYEKLRHEHKQMEIDFQTLLTLKEEGIQEKDVLLRKIDRLQTELRYLLNGDSRRVAEDVDDLLAENRFLKAQLNNAQEETDSMKATLAKFRTAAEANERRKRLEEGRERTKSEDTLEDKSSVAVINMKQIREMLSNQAIDLDESDFRTISTILLDLCNDKQMALAHQRRANKILGSRLAEVEAKLARLESGKSARSTSPYLSPPSDRPSQKDIDSILAVQ